MTPRAALRLAPAPAPRGLNPRSGLRRDPGARPNPPAHAFAVLGYVLWIAGVPVRRMEAAPGGFVEIA